MSGRPTTPPVGVLVLREQTVWVYAGLPDSTRSRRRPLELGMSRVELTFVTVRALDVSLCESVRVCTSRARLVGRKKCDVLVATLPGRA